MRGQHRRWRLLSATAVTTLAVALALAGCGGSRSASSTSAGDKAAAPAPANGAGGAAQAGKAGDLSAGGKDTTGGGTALGGAAGAPAQVPGDSAQRDIVYTGAISVRVTSVDEAASKLAGMVSVAGGFIGNDQRTLNNDQSTATITIRVPVDKFTGLVDQVGKLGTEESRQISAEDVTAKMIDLESRIKTQQASVDRIRVLLAKAQSVSEIATIEGELSRREADLESLQAQQRSLADLATYSTVTVSLLGPLASVAAPAKPRTGFLAGLSSGWHALLDSLGVLLTILGAVLPFAVALGVPAWLVVRWLRRRSRRQAPPVPAYAAVPAGRPGPAAPGVPPGLLTPAGAPAAGPPPAGPAPAAPVPAGPPAPTTRT